MDLRSRAELEYLGDLIGAIHSAAPETQWLLVGATARDLLTYYGHGIQVPRATEDVDLGVAVTDWTHFQDIRHRLLESDLFVEVPNVSHQVRYQSQVRVDLIPFGGVERSDGTIAWPPAGIPQMTVTGSAEALREAQNIILPGARTVAVVSLPMLVFLKMIAWSDRHERRPGVDVADAVFILANYLDCGNRNRLFEDEADLVDDPDFDYELAGANLAGRDLRRILTKTKPGSSPMIETLKEIIQSQLATTSPGLMLQQLPAQQLDQSARLLESFLNGLTTELP